MSIRCTLLNILGAIIVQKIQYCSLDEMVITKSALIFLLKQHNFEQKPSY